jgi:hypothetical protein
MKKVILNALVAELRATLEQHTEFLNIRTMLVPYEGKKLSGDVKLLDGYTIDFHRIVDTVVIISPAGNVHFIGWIKDEIFSIATFERLDIKYNETCLNKAARLQQLINQPAALIVLFIKLKKLKDSLQDVFTEIKRSGFDANNNPAFGRICKALNIRCGMLKKLNAKKA